MTQKGRGEGEENGSLKIDRSSKFGLKPFCKCLLRDLRQDISTQRISRLKQNDYGNTSYVCNKSCLVLGQ